MQRQPRAHRVQAAVRQVDVVRAGGEAVEVHRLADRGPRPLVDGQRAHQQVGVAADVLGRRVQRDVDAVRQRLEVERRRPRVVDDAEGVVPARDRREPRHVLHLEGQRARRLQEEHARGRTEQLLQLVADARVVERRVDAEPRQRLPAEAARRPVDRVGDQHVVAGPYEREQRHRAGGEAGRQRPAAVAALQRVERGVERVVGRRAVDAVGQRRRRRRRAAPATAPSCRRRCRAAPWTRAPAAD